MSIKFRAVKADEIDVRIQQINKYRTTVLQKEKGLASDSFKRACFCWGIGRELYTTPVIQVPTEYLEVKDNNGRLTTYDKFRVLDLETVEDEKTGAKRISKIGISIEHKGQSDWIYAWTAEQGEKTHKPKWL